jgi:hypothetical protein
MHDGIAVPISIYYVMNALFGKIKKIALFGKIKRIKSPTPQHPIPRLFRHACRNSAAYSLFPDL